MAKKMPAKKPPATAGGKPLTDKSPATAGKGHWVIPADLVTAAAPGNRVALARAYGVAAAGIRAGWKPPAELANWLADRLEKLSQVLADKRDKKMAGVPRALGLVEAGKPGRKPGREGRTGVRLNEQQRRELIMDITYHRCRNGGTMPEVFERVVKFYHAAGHTSLTTTQVASAWKDRKRLFPELESSRH